MSNRSDIVDALKTVSELSPTSRKPDTILAGMAWPGWTSTDPRTICGKQETWYVYVALPVANTETTVIASDDLRDTVADALMTVAKVVTYEDWQIPVEPGQQGIPVVRYTLEV